MKVRCHKNLHRGDWSITVKGKVIDHRKEIILSNVRFIIRESARLRVIEKHCREVHAWAEGETVETMPQGSRISLTYNPYAAPTFTERETGKPVTECEYVHFTVNDGAVEIRSAY